MAQQVSVAVERFQAIKRREKFAATQKAAQKKREQRQEAIKTKIRTANPALTENQVESILAAHLRLAGRM